VNLVPQPHSHEGSEVVVGVVETPAETRLRDLAETIRREHELLVAATRAMVLHAVAVGDALLEAKRLVPAGEWTVWIEANMPYERRRSMCQNYMRLAALKDHIDPDLSITSNLQLVRGLEKRSSATPRVPEEVKREALRLHATGEFTNAAIARMVGTTKESVRCWTDPEYAHRKSQQLAARRRAQRAERRPELVAAEESGDRRFRYGEPGRAAIGRAVRRLAEVQGKVATREALLDLAAISEAWAARLDSSETREAA
jgi:hypothetical protein